MMLMTEKYDTDCDRINLYLHEQKKIYNFMSEVYFVAVQSMHVVAVASQKNVTPCQGQCHKIPRGGHNNYDCAPCVSPATVTTSPLLNSPFSVALMHH